MAFLTRFGTNPALKGFGMKEERKTQSISFSDIPKSPLDLWRLMGGKTRPVGGVTQPPHDSLLAVYKDRVTYTFILEREVASIHFDRVKKEIFFKGHNIRNFKPHPVQIEALKGFKKILAADERGKAFLVDYEATLGASLADKDKEGV